MIDNFLYYQLNCKKINWSTQYVILPYSQLEFIYMFIIQGVPDQLLYKRNGQVIWATLENFFTFVVGALSC